MATSSVKSASKLQARHIVGAAIITGILGILIYLVTQLSYDEPYSIFYVYHFFVLIPIIVLFIGWVYLSLKILLWYAWSSPGHAFGQAFVISSIAGIVSLLFIGDALSISVIMYTALFLSLLYFRNNNH